MKDVKNIVRQLIDVEERWIDPIDTLKNIHHISRDHLWEPVRENVMFQVKCRVWMLTRDIIKYKNFSNLETIYGYMESQC